MEIARWSRRIAIQSAGIGMTLSLLAMVAAAFGWIAPAPGALLQEGIDVAVILNALRALGGGRSPELTVTRETGLLLQRFDREHDDLRGALALIRDAAEQVSTGTGPETLALVRRAHTVLVERVLPHERAEETELYPAPADAFGTVEAAAPMSRVMRRSIDSAGDWTLASARLRRTAGSARISVTTFSRVCTGCMRCCVCISPRRKRTTSALAPRVEDER